MAQLCARCGGSADDGARFCPSCGSPLFALEGAERKLATIVFADLVGSTELASSLDPEELRRRLAPFFEVARAALEEHGGTIEKYLGDAVMAVFGVPQSHGDDPDRAVAAALDLSKRVESLDRELSVRIGVETGEVLATQRGGDLSVTGEAVNAAARLQQGAEPREVLVGERAARACRVARVAERPPIQAKGFSEPLAAWTAVGAAPPGSAETNGVSTPFIGRKDDLALLELVYRRTVRDRVPELVTITGDAGVGKTRLAAELIEALRSADPAPQILLGRNPPYGRGIAFWALGEILRAAAGAGADDSVGDVHDAFARRLREFGAEDADELGAVLGTALGGEAIDGDIEDELKHAWRRLVALLASERPLVIGIDDAHWADDGLLDLVEEVVFRLDDAPLLVICTTRPELLERRADFGRAARNVTQIELRPLTREAAGTLATALLPSETQDLASRVAEASGGNPFFAEEVACAIAEGRGVDHLPDTVQAAIAARLDLLPPVEKRMLQHAAVLGQNFLEVALAELSGSSPESALRSLTEKALLQERLTVGPGRYGFRHHLIRDVAYASLPRAERARLHERGAEDIVSRAGERFTELAELVAYHRVQAAGLDPTPTRSEAAHVASVEAARIAARRGATARAQELYEQAAGLAADEAGRVDALRAAAELALQRWRGDEAIPLLKRAAAISEDAGDARRAASAYARTVEMVARMGGVSGTLPEDELAQMLQRGRELVPDDDTVTRARLLLDEAWIAWRFGRETEMAEPSRAALELARGTDDVPLMSSALDAMSALAWGEVRYGDAVEHVRERLELLAETGGGAQVGIEYSDALHMMVESLVAAGESRAAAEYAKQARELDLSVGTVYSGWARGLLPSFFLGDWDSALEMADALREAWAAADRPPIAALAAALACAGAILGYRGDEDASADWFRFASSVSPACGGQTSGVAMLQADVELHRGCLAEAVALVDDVPTTTMWWRSAYAATRAEVVALAGDGRVDELTREAVGWVGDHRYAQGVLLRAEGVRHDDEASLRKSLAVFEEIECPYQAARTGWLLGGAERAEAERKLAALGATPLAG
ncbi:MAG: ATP-binding protein [Solirubrobacterales bacterium]